MPFDKTPTTHIPNWSENGTNITVPIASFPELTDAEADAANGDIRKIEFALNEKLYAAYAAQAVADRPVNFTRSRGVTIDSATMEMTVQHTVRFVIASASVEVKDE